MDNETYARRIAGLARLAAAAPAGDRGGMVKADVRKYLHDYAGGKCALCGRATRLDAGAHESDKAEISHLISLKATFGDKASKMGIMPGMVFNGCRGCNLATSDKSLIEYLHLFADIFAIPCEWPTFGQMRRDNARTPKKDIVDESLIRRKALGFDF